MVSTILSPELQMEEEIVAELARLGIRYLSRLSQSGPHRNHPPEQLIADLTRQPSSRVRGALISLLLAQPGFAAQVPPALQLVNREQGVRLKFFYTAAVLLQRKFADQFLQDKLQALPDLFSWEMGLSGTNVDDQLRQLGLKHQQATGQYINWKGSYENAASCLLRQWELESIWSLS